jgi:putative ABC transport system permease protein
VRDLRYACRQLRLSPGFTALAVVTLALGIGANTAMFTVLESVLLRPLPYANPDRLVAIGPPDSGPSGSASWLDYRDIGEQAQFAEAVAASSEDLGVLQTRDGFLSLATPRVTPNLLGMLGARPLFGRAFAANDRDAVLLSEGLWRQTFQADREILGRTVRVNGRESIVVGVMPRGFRFPESMGPGVEKGLWLPLQPAPEMLADRGYHFLKILAAVKPGVTLAQARAGLAAMASKRAQREPPFQAAFYRDIVAGAVRTVFLALVAALALVLLIACGNVANLLIARCLARRQEFALRAALGAGQGRLVLQMIVEGGLLSILGCLLGFGLAAWAVAAIHKLPAGVIPRAEGVEIRWTIVGVLAAIASFTTLASSLVPALLVSRSDPQSALQGATRGRSSKALRARVGGWLVAAELALSALLLVATGLLFRTLWNLEHTRLGFETARVTTFSAMPADAAGFANITLASGPRHAASVATLVYRPVLDQIRNAPGVFDAALVTAAPFSGVSMQTSFRIIGRPEDPDHAPEAKMTAVSGGYERAMGTPVARGRMIGEADSADAPFAAAINEAFARKYFAGRNPVGERLDLGGEGTGMPRPYTIVGVLGDQVDTSASQPPQPLLMLPYQQIPAASLFYPALLKTSVNFVVKTRADLDAGAIARAVFKRSAPDFVLDGFRTMQQAVDQSNFSTRIGLYLIGAFAGLAVLMVIAGLYGVLAQVVNGRRQEIGVRLALGASPYRILWMVLIQGSLIVAVGCLAGLTLALSTSRLVSSFLYGVKALDVWTYASVTAALFVVGGFAALVPAWRAASVNPVETLRET